MLAGYDHLLRAAERLRWDEAALDLTADAAAWPALAHGMRGPLTRLFAGFWVAEHAVAQHLAPFEADAEGELAACFAAQADDERRHARFFTRVAREVMGLDPDEEARALAGPGITGLFGRELPAMASDLARGDRSLGDAVALYHLVLEGLVFHTGQQAALDLLDEAGTLPAVREGVARVQGDERWHVGLGVRTLADVGLGGAADILDRAEVATRAWGDVVSPELAAAALARHRRRLLETAPKLGAA